MKLEDLENLAKDARLERDRKIVAANRELEAALDHIKWVTNRLKRNGHQGQEASAQVTEPGPIINGEAERGSLVAGIKQSISALREFSTADLVNWMEKHRADLRATARRTQISTALVRLRENGYIEITGTTGAGNGRAGKYRIVKEFDD